MPHTLRVNLLGFGSFERRTLESVFRLSSARDPAYEVVDMPADADLLVVDADQPSAVQLAVAAERLGEAVFIGAHAPPGARAWMARPIEPLHVLRELDALRLPAPAAPRGEPADPVDPVEPADAPQQDTVPLSFVHLEPPAAPVPPVPRVTSAPRVPRERQDREGRQERQARHEPAQPPSRPRQAAAAAAAPPRPAPPPGPQAPQAPRAPQALLVDDSDLALHFLARLLQRQGLQCSMAATSGRALELMARQAFDAVFIDVELGDGSDLDGLALCQHIRRHRPGPPGATGGAAGPAQPLLALVSAHHSPSDRVRGTLAGADTYLAKPLDEAALAHWLRRQGLSAAVGAAAGSAGSPASPASPASPSPAARPGAAPARAPQPGSGRG
jgi:CheY-like chemotaxis protein